MLPSSFNQPHCPNAADPQPCALPLAAVSAYPQKEGTHGTPVREARVASGLILLLLIGILVGFGVGRVRKRMGLGMTWATWVTTVLVVGFLLLLLWVTSVKH
jgi:hypothetical protein